ncbi:MAG: HAD-IC family P-type ATPase, partial [Candidatus Sigynarchaeum springense]
MSKQEMQRKANLKISGMTCASCVATIEKSVKNLDGVLDIKVNLSTENASLEYDPAKVDLGQVEKVVSDLGYKVVNEQVDVKIGGMHCAACVSTLEKAIGSVDGVSSVAVNLAAENAVVRYNPQVTTVDDIKKAIEGAGYQYMGKREDLTIDAETEAVRKNLTDKKRRALVGMGVGIILFIMMFAWIPGEMDMEGMQARMYVMLAIATPAFFFASFPIFKAMLSSLKNRSLNMDVMYGMGIGVAYGASVAGTFLGGIVHELMQFMFFDAAVMLAGFLMLGRYLETRAKSRTSDAIKKLVGLQPRTATVIREGKEVTIAAEEIQAGDLIIVKPGERLPADGIVVNGTSYVDESMITGEPIPVLKQVDSKVVGGTINKNSVLRFTAQKVGKDTVLSQIIKLVQEAQSTKPPIQKLADKAVTWFIPVVLAIAIATFLTWLFVLGEWLNPLTRLITILVVACPCALGLATPTAVTVGIGRGAELGILIKNGEVLEKVNKLTTVIFDKTGTL